MIFKDLETLWEAYATVVEKANKKPDKDQDSIPDWADKEPNNKKKSKKTPDIKEERLSFNELYGKIISEKKPTLIKISVKESHSLAHETDKRIKSIRKQVNPEAQYYIHYKDGKRSKPLKGESVIMMADEERVHNIASIEPVHKQ